MICHVHTVISADQYKDTDEEESNQVFPGASFFHAVCQQRQGKQNADNGHMTAGPALVIIIAAGQVGDHLSPAAESGSGIVKGQQVFRTRAESSSSSATASVTCMTG